MLKQKKTEEIFHKYVPEYLKSILQKHKYRYNKKRHEFKRKYNDVEHVIVVRRPRQPFVYDEDCELLLCHFELLAYFSDKGYYEWWKENTKHQALSPYKAAKINGIATIPVSEIANEEFISPTVFVTENDYENILSLVDIMSTDLPNIVADLEERSDDPRKISNQSSRLQSQQPFYLHYRGFPEEAKILADQTYDNLVKEVEENTLERKQKEKEYYLSEFIELCRDLLNIKY